MYWYIIINNTHTICTEIYTNPHFHQQCLSVPFPEILTGKWSASLDCNLWFKMSESWSKKTDKCFICSLKEVYKTSHAVIPNLQVRGDKNAHTSSHSLATQLRENPPSNADLLVLDSSPTFFLLSSFIPGSIHRNFAGSLTQEREKSFQVGLVTMSHEDLATRPATYLILPRLWGPLALSVLPPRGPT